MSLHAAQDANAGGTVRQAGPGPGPDLARPAAGAVSFRLAQRPPQPDQYRANSEPESE
jgi:hypothetical protein